MISKKQRFGEFLKRLQAAAAAKNHDQAFALLATTLNAVEDELSGIASDPSKWMDDGRMYPPQADNAYETPMENVVRYRSKAHNTYIHQSGAIRIETVSQTCLLNKPGHNGHLIER